ncbi:hypothetical protein B0J18DRAFT_418646 [Chaetomium sp. MPI-SDFR-AT-0129]|nr:hypothetical protein B0J18DRAFT_418646 [Chaetomium sp. MPI-SDFR-AT-0129]
MPSTTIIHPVPPPTHLLGTMTPTQQYIVPCQAVWHTHPHPQPQPNPHPLPQSLPQPLQQPQLQRQPLLHPQNPHPTVLPHPQSQPHISQPSQIPQQQQQQPQIRQQQHSPSHLHPVFFTDKLRRPPFHIVAGPHTSPIAHGYVYQDGQRGVTRL